MSTFRGGVHPPESKTATETEATVRLPLPERVYIPMSQHIGAPSKPVVAKGDEVKVGTVIGEPRAAVSVPTHSSVSGRVTDVAPMLHPLTGTKVPTCVIESDGQDTPAEGIGERTTDGLAPADIVAAVRDAGIVGMGGAAFPTHFKLSPPAGKPIDTLLINGCECEPYLTADHRLMLERTGDLVAGTGFIARALGVEEIIIGIEDNKPDAVARVREATAGTGFRVRALRTKYPQGAEKQLIKACLGREVPSGGLPLDVGCVVQNVGTAVAVSEAVRLNRPLVERVTTVTGPGVTRPANLWVRIGTPVSALIEACGGYAGEPAKLIMGGPMMGIAVSTDAVPVLKGTSGVLVLDAASAAELRDHDCIRCGRCIKACPMGLAPQNLYYHIRSRRWDDAEKAHVLDCIECGCCAYACPAKIRLVHHFKLAKSEIARRKRK